MTGTDEVLSVLPLTAHGLIMAADFEYLSLGLVFVPHRRMILLFDFFFGHQTAIMLIPAPRLTEAP